MKSATSRPSDDAKTFVYRSGKGASLLDVRTALTQLKAVLIDAAATQIDISCVEIVVAEILNNVVKHAHRGTDSGWFEIQCTFLSTGYHIICRDNGAPMPGGIPPGGVLPGVDRPRSELPEGGWGWSLVRTLSANLSYMRVQKINIVSFKIACRPPPLRH